MIRRYEYTRRAETIGGGWTLRLFDDDKEIVRSIYSKDEEEVNGEIIDYAFAAAQEEAEAWIDRVWEYAHWN